jgi:carboxypeptidase family protein/putative zinc finger protein
MSELIQSGQHPDADQLSAFVEHALPAHERDQMLAHLATCADCRAIVALSLPPLDEAPALQPEPARRPWLSGWNLAWPAAGLAALAALVFFIVHLHSAEPIKGGIAPPAEIATSRPPSPLPVQSAPSVSTPVPPAPPASKPVSSNRPAAADTAKARVPIPTNATAMPGQSTVNGRLENSRLAGLAQGQGAGAGGAVNGPPPAPMPAPAPAPNLPAIAPNGPQPNVVTAGNADSTAPLAAQAKTPPIPYSQARAAAASPAAAGAVSVDSDSNVIGATNTINGYNVDPNTAPARLLPSHLPTLSSARNGHQVLAIDTQNALFYSEDDGKHWTSVASHWRGRALRVAVARPAAPAITAAVSSFGAIGGPISAAPARAAGLPSLSGTITDATGAVISGASITISDAANKVTRTVTSDRSGRYLVDNLSAGSYQLGAMAPGFQKLRLAVSVVASQQNQANLTLTVGQAAETVTVQAETSDVALAAPQPALKKAAPASAAKLPVAIFEITTDNGERWASPDGKTWTKR